MPRMSKKRKQEWEIFLNQRGRITFNPICCRCRKLCKQSYKSVVVECPNYHSKRSKKAA